MTDLGRPMKAVRIDASGRHTGADNALVAGAACLAQRLPGPQPSALCDHFVEREGLEFAGTHLILDLWNASNLDDLPAVEHALREAAEAAGATLLKIDLHSFKPTGGITGVAILAESHISIHTWPERSYAALDLFMCGDARPYEAVAVIRKAFAPGNVSLVEHKRGVAL